MSQPIRLLHFADIHIGMENYGKIDPSTGVNGRVLDFIRRMDEVVHYALDHEADLVIFAGDAYKTRDPNPTYQREFARRIKRLSDAGIPCVLLVGNHDLPVMDKRASSVDIFSTLSVPNVVVGRNDEMNIIDTRHGPVQVATVPYPMRSRLLAAEEYRGKNIDELDAAVRSILIDNMLHLASQVRPDLPAVLTAHFSVVGALWGSERSVMIGRDVTVPKSVLTDAAWDYVALGHVHKHQNLNEGQYPAVVYSGSLERIDFGEEREPKGFAWVELVRGATTWQFIPVQSRRFLTIRAELRGESDPTSAALAAIEKVQAQLEGAIVRVILKMAAEDEPRLNEKALFEALGPAYSIAALQKDIERNERGRLDGKSVESLTPAELLERYLELKGTAPDRIVSLLQRADAIFSGESEE